MYNLYWKDKLVAKQDGELLFVLDKTLAPYTLFTGKDTANIFEFTNWLKGRVFQDSRVDKDNLLKELGLKEYDVLKIADKTKAILTGVDFYSVEWID